MEKLSYLPLRSPGRLDDGVLVFGGIKLGLHRTEEHQGWLCPESNGSVDKRLQGAMSCDFLLLPT